MTYNYRPPENTEQTLRVSRGEVAGQRLREVALKLLTEAAGAGSEQTKVDTRIATLILNLAASVERGHLEGRIVHRNE